MYCVIHVQVFSPEGEFLLKFGSNGEGNGQFNAPTGVAVDGNGNIIVADWGNSRIQVLKVQTTLHMNVKWYISTGGLSTCTSRKKC